MTARGASSGPGFPGRGLFAVLLALGILLRVVAVFTFPVYPLVNNTADTEIYDAGARSIAGGEGYRWGGRPTAFFPVGWPLVLAGAYKLFGESPRSGQVMNLILSLVLIAASWAFARRLHGDVAARRVAVLLALAPHQIVYPAFLMSEVAFTAFFMTALWLLSPGTRTLPRLFLSGFLTGGATLIRAVSLVYPLVTFLFARFGERRTWRGSVLATLVFTVALLLALAPWAVRNHSVFGRWVLVANDGGMNFLMGNHEGATGARHEPAGGLPSTGDEVADDREGYRRGLEFIRTRPLEFLSLLPRKLARLTLAAPLLTYREELLAKWPRIVALAAMGLDQLLHVGLWGVVVAGFAGIVRRRRPPPRGLLLPCLVLGLWFAIHMAFLGGARYFFPMMPVLIMLAVMFMGGWREGEGARG